MELHRLLLLLFPALYLVAPLLISAWQQFNLPWYSPYMVWLFIIIAAYVLSKGEQDA